MPMPIYVWGKVTARISESGDSSPKSVRIVKRWRMKSRVAIWAGAGLVVAGCWALYATMTAPEAFLMSLQEPLVKAALYLTCPVAFAGRYFPIQLWWVLLINAATYATIGSIVELSRMKTKLRTAT